METYAMALNIAIPVFIVLMLLELAVSYMRGTEVSNLMDAVSSLSSGVTNITKDVLGLGISIISYSWLRDHIAFFSLPVNGWTVALSFIGLDFAQYWIHRIEHRVNIFWNRHIIHHSSEEYNLACALRQPISDVFSYYPFFLLPMAVMGVPAEIFAMVAPVHLFLQFWYHTRLIGKMGFLEKFLMTPSHHRVHHAINPEYLDKNYAPIFVLWDKWFGTFQEELDEVPPVYGVKRPVKSWNPLWISVQHFFLILSDAWHTKKWSDKFRIWFMPTGWRPEDVKEKYPVKVWENVYDQVKYQTSASLLMKSWSAIQLVVTLVLALYLFNRISDLPGTQMLVYGAFIFYSVFSYTSLMDGNRMSWGLEMVRAGGMLGWIWLSGDWFRASELWSGIPAAVAMYAVVSAVMVSWIYFREQSPGRQFKAVAV